MQWGKRKIDGVIYDLTHLDPLIITIPGHGEAEPIKARVRFGSHVFTIKWEDAYVATYLVQDGAKKRCFCPERFGHSQHLPSLIGTACAGRVLFDPAKKLVMLGNPPGAIFPYAVYFELRRDNQPAYDLDLVVVSAHAKPLVKAKLGMSFPHLARVVADGGAVPWPKK